MVSMQVAKSFELFSSKFCRMRLMTSLRGKLIRSLTISAIAAMSQVDAANSEIDEKKINLRSLNYNCQLFTL